MSTCWHRLEGKGGIFSQDAIKVLPRRLEHTTISRSRQNSEIQFGQGTGLALHQQRVGGSMARRRNVPRKRYSHRTIFRDNHPTSKHRSPRFIALKIGWRPYSIKGVPACAILIAYRGRRCPRLILTRRTLQFIFWIHAILRTVDVSRSTEWRSRVEAISPEKFARWRDINPDVIMVGVIAIDRPYLVINQT